MLHSNLKSNEIKKSILVCLAVGGICLLTPSCSDYLEREDDGKLQEAEVFPVIQK